MCDKSSLRYGNLQNKYVLPGSEECWIKRSTGMAMSNIVLGTFNICVIKSDVSIKTVLFIVVEKFASKPKSL